MELLTTVVDFNLGSSVNVNGIRNGSDECCLFNHCVQPVGFDFTGLLTLNLKAYRSARRDDQCCGRDTRPANYRTLDKDCSPHRTH